MSVEIAFESKVIVPAETLVMVADREAVLLKLGTVSYYSLDNVGTRFWECLCSSSSISAACDVLEREFEAPPGKIREDMRSLLAALKERGLVTFEGA